MPDIGKMFLSLTIRNILLSVNGIRETERFENRKNSLYSYLKLVYGLLILIVVKQAAADSLNFNLLILLKMIKLMLKNDEIVYITAAKMSPAS